jgi:hypothetical protein
MRLVRVLVGAVLAAFAVIAGLITAAAIALAGALFVGLRRLLRRDAAAPLPNRPRRPASNEVIDVTATEVTSDR